MSNIIVGQMHNSIIDFYIKQELYTREDLVVHCDDNLSMYNNQMKFLEVIDTNGINPDNGIKRNTYYFQSKHAGKHKNKKK